MGTSSVHDNLSIYYQYLLKDAPDYEVFLALAGDRSRETGPAGIIYD
jgi:hypothetical protein